MVLLKLKKLFFQNHAENYIAMES